MKKKNKKKNNLPSKPTDLLTGIPSTSGPDTTDVILIICLVAFAVGIGLLIAVFKFCECRL